MVGRVEEGRVRARAGGCGGCGGTVARNVRESSGDSAGERRVGWMKGKRGGINYSERTNEDEKRRKKRR